MKRYLGIVLAAMFLFGFAASAFAIHAEIPSETQAVVAKGATQITLGGELRVRGEIQKNTDFDDTNSTGDASFYDQRVRLSLKADVTKNTTGFIHLESNNGGNTGDNVTWGEGETGTGGSGAKGIFGQGNSKKGDLRILEAWILHKGTGLLGIPAGIKVGHMPLALGNKLFFAHDKFGDDAIVFFMDPTKELHIGLLTAKFDEGANTASPNDSDAYVGLFVYSPSKDTSISGDITYVNDQNNLLGGGADIHMWNFGLRGNTNVSGLGIKADIEIQSGKAVDLGAGASDIKFRGWAALVGLSYKLDPVTLSLEYATGSGDDDPNDNKIKSFVTSLSADPHFTYVYEYRTRNANGDQFGGLTNTQYFKLGANFAPAKDLTADLGIFVLRANKKFQGVPELGATTYADSKSIGTEVDAKISYKIDKNLTYWVEGGYLWAGNFWKQGATPAAASAARNPDDAYAVRHGIMLSF